MNPTEQEIIKAHKIVSDYFAPGSDSRREVLVKAIATALAAAPPSQLQNDVDKFWLALERSWGIEPREFFEKEARENGFESPLAMAVHYMWKRNTKPSVSQWQPKLQEACDVLLATNALLSAEPSPLSNQDLGKILMDVRRVILSTLPARPVKEKP